MSLESSFKTSEIIIFFFLFFFNMELDQSNNKFYLQLQSMV